MLSTVNCSNSNSMKKIQRNLWNALRDVYKVNWPRHILSYHTLKTYIEWVQHNPKLDVTIFTSDDNWPQHGTYVIVEHSGPRCNVLFNTLDANKYHDLLLNTLGCLGIYQPFTLAAFVEQVQPIADHFIESSEVTRIDSCETVLFHLPMKESLQLPKEDKFIYDFRNLSLDDASLINSLWPHRYPGSDLFIENLIRYNFTLGAYEKRSGKLCGWVVQEQVGTIGLLQVEDSYKRKGIGEQLVICMAVLLANAGMDATATVMSTNRASRHLFHKLGFKVIDKVFWNDIIPLSQANEDGGLFKFRSELIQT